METKNTPDTGPALTPEERQTLINHGIDPDSGMPLEVAQAMERDRAVMLSGDAPFDDRVRTAEQIAESLAKERAELAREQEKKNRKHAREEALEASRSADNREERRLAKLISRYKFFNELSQGELDKCSELNEWTRDSCETKPRRKMVFSMLFHYTRVQFTANRRHHVVMTKGASRYNSEAYRIADLFIYLLWEYRNPGKLGVSIADHHVNLSLNRIYTDLNSEPELVQLLKDYRDVLVREHHITKINTRSNINSINTTVRKHTCTTLTEELRKLTGELVTLRADVVALRAEHNALQSHHTTAHGVTVTRLNEIQSETRAISTSVEVHKQNLLTVLGITSNLENRLATLEEKKQCLNAAESTMPDAEVVPQ